MLLFQMINISTDPVDQINFKNGVAVIEEDLNINEIESVFELISEKIFDQGIPESDENDEDTFIKYFNYFCSVHTHEFLSSIIFEFQLIHDYFYLDMFNNTHSEPSSPPPKQV